MPVHITRDIFAALLDWRARSNRKVLLLRGPRQVGKTYIVRQLRSQFTHFLEINFLESGFAKGLFDPQDLNPHALLSRLSGYYGVPIEDDRTLLFLDEVQACPAAISALRFLHEKRPGLHVIAAGSLLEFALADIPSFGVGRIESLFMHPLTFKEFLGASTHQGLVSALSTMRIDEPHFEVFHHRLVSICRSFMCIGGLPEVVVTFLEGNDYSAAMHTLDTIRTGLEQDFSLYSGRVPLARLKEVLRSSALQAGKKFIHTHAYPDASSQQVQHALGLLSDAGIINRMYHSHCAGLPLGAGVDLKKFKVLPFDHALYQRLIGITPAELLLANDIDMLNKGALAEVYVANQILAHSTPTLPGELYYWHREARSANAEVDLVVPLDGHIVPIEVKAGSRGGMKSLRVFMHEKGSAIGVRVAFEQPARVGELLVIPIYAISELQRLVREA